MLNASNSIQDANQLDLSNAKKFALSVSEIDRLTITPKRLADMANSMVEIATLKDPIGRVLEGGFRPNGLQVLKVGVPLGVLFLSMSRGPMSPPMLLHLVLKVGMRLSCVGAKRL